MKRFVCLFVAMLLCLTVSALADETVHVTVTIANGELMLAQQKVAVSDSDGDGVISINDALFCAHEAAYPGGAAEGYGSEPSIWGISITKLWSVENGGSYGYYINNTSPMSLADPIQESDMINAFVYTDTADFSDQYCWFETAACEAEAGNSITLTLLGAGFDENWAPVTFPVEGAVLTVNGETTQYVTDAEGSVTFTVESGDMLLVSAVSDSLNLVPPVCVINGAK